MKDVRCSNHLIELFLKDSLEGFLVDLLAKCQELSTKVRKSPNGKGELKAACNKVKIKFVLPKLACKTRWNSRHANLDSIIKLKKAINYLVVEDSNEDWGEFWFSSSNWKKMESVAEVLEKVKVVSKALEAEATPTSNLVIFNLKPFCRISLEALQLAGFEFYNIAF